MTLSCQHVPIFRNPTMISLLLYMLLHYSYLFGEAGRGGAHYGPIGDSSTEHRLNRTNEAGLSRTDWTQEENPGLSHLLTVWFVGADSLHQVCLLPEYKILGVQNHLNK